MTNRYYSLETNSEDRTADLYIFGDIVDPAHKAIDEWFLGDVGEVSGLSIVQEIKSLDVDLINVHINSLGGYTAEGLAIFNVLKNHPALVATFCDGFACSAASLVFMAGDERIMGSASMLMIHNAWVEAQGNAEQLRLQAEVLDKISTAAGNAYMEHVNISRDELDALLDGENHDGTWILPEEAVRMGFATGIAKASASSIANQSAAAQIIQRLTAKAPTAKAQVANDTDAIAEAVYQKLAARLQPTPPAEPEPASADEKTLNNFLLALAKRGKE